MHVRNRRLGADRNRVRSDRGHVVNNLRHIEEALAGLTNAELHALKVASKEAPQVAPGLLAWMEGACDWELNRRHGFRYALQPPEAAIDPSEDAVSIDAAYAMRSSFAAGDQDNGALTLLDAVVELLTATPTNTSAVAYVRR